MVKKLKPLICFYEHENYIFSKNYTLRECPAQQKVYDFLKEIEDKFSSSLKVVQLNFEFDNQKLFVKQKNLYGSAKASVFILNEFRIGPLPEILVSLSTTSAFKGANFQSNVNKEKFIKKTKFVIEQIANGRIYQANLTAPLSASCSDPTEDVFCYYQSRFTGAYKALLPLKHVDLHCFSPELFLQQRNGTLLTRPIKGSLSQGKDFDTQLFANEKEEAELSMIVDLLRNDLNALSEENNAVVVSHRERMKLGYIQHTFSEISVKCDQPLSQVLEKTFPGGSISGCPKIESLIVIREVEDYQRQIYTGSLGWWQNNEFTLNIVIRSLIQSDDQLFYHAGCGIVYDSDPEAEWDEFILKTGALNVV